MKTYCYTYDAQAIVVALSIILGLIVIIMAWFKLLSYIAPASKADPPPPYSLQSNTQRKPVLVLP